MSCKTLECRIAAIAGDCKSPVFGHRQFESARSNYIADWRRGLSRLAHNQENGGSNPPSATMAI